MTAPERITTIDHVAHALITQCGTPFDVFLSEALASGQTTFATRTEYPQWVARPFKSDIRDDLPPMTCRISQVDAGKRQPAGSLISVSDLELSKGVAYHSARFLRTGDERIYMPSHVRVEETTLPDTMMTALVGQHVTALVDHPALRHPGLIIEGLSQDDGSLVIQLPEILIDAGPEGRDEIPYTRPEREDD